MRLIPFILQALRELTHRVIFFHFQEKHYFWSDIWNVTNDIKYLKFTLSTQVYDITTPLMYVYAWMQVETYLRTK